MLWFIFLLYIFLILYTHTHTHTYSQPNRLYQFSEVVICMLMLVGHGNSFLYYICFSDFITRNNDHKNENKIKMFDMSV